MTRRNTKKVPGRLHSPIPAEDSLAATATAPRRHRAPLGNHAEEEAPEGKKRVDLGLQLVDMDRIDGNYPDWVPDDWQTHVGERINSLSEVDVSTLTGAIALGWKVVVCLDDTDNTITIVSPDEDERLYFAPGRRQRKDRLRKTILRHAIPERVVELEEADGEVWTVMDNHPQRMVPVQLIRSEPDPEPVEPVDPGIYLVETKPMLAQSSRGMGYHSKIAIERIWSDGSTDYKCVLCDFVRTNRLSMRGHWQKHIKSGEASSVGGPKAGERFQAEVPKAASYMPRQNRIDALAELLAKMLEAEVEDPDELAMAALTWVHEQTRHGTGLAAETEELTDTERVHRIRLLLGMPDPAILEQLATENTKLIAEITDLKGAVRRQADKIERVTAERDQFRKRAARAQGDLQSLRELVQGLGSDEDEEEGA